MRIGVNAQPLVNALTGIGQYTLALLKHLVTDHPDVEWVLYASGPLTTPFFDGMKNVTLSIHPTPSKIQQVLFFAFCMKKILEKDNIDVFWSPTHILPLQKSKTVKYVMSVHDLVCIKMPKTMPFVNAIKDKLLFFPSVRNADAIFALSKTTRHDLIHHVSLKTDPILVYPAYEKIKSDDKKSPLVSGKYILSVCTKEPRKNLSALLKAYLQLPTTLQQEYTLVFCGSNGWKSSGFLKAIAEASKTHPIINFDYVTDDERNNLYQHATLFVFPTLYEGFGLPVIEAMSYGIPVLTSDIPIMREVGRDAALYANPNNTQAIADQIQEILTYPERLSEYSRKAVQHYTHYNSWKHGADIIWETMRSLPPLEAMNR